VLCRHLVRAGSSAREPARTACILMEPITKTVKMKYLLISSFLILSFNLGLPVGVFGQEPPPAMAMPNKQNLKLINQLIEVTDFKSFFETYCVGRISNTSKKNNWSDAKTKEITGSINFDYFTWHVQNALAFYSKKELQDLIELYKKDLAESKLNNIIVNDNLVRRSLEDFSVELIKGSYVMPK
jgi:hypothetical protein